MQCKFNHPQTIEVLTIMVLQHAVQYHEARDWIWLQNQSQLTYQSLLAHCKLLESCCEHYQNAKEKGCADLTTITAATSSASSIHTDTLSTYPCCNKGGCSHPYASVQPRDNPLMLVVATTIIQPCANSGRRHSNPLTILPEELTEAPEEPDHPRTTDQNAEVITPVSPS